MYSTELVLVLYVLMQYSVRRTCTAAVVFCKSSPALWVRYYSIITVQVLYAVRTRTITSVLEYGNTVLGNSVLQFEIVCNTCTSTSTVTDSPTLNSRSCCPLLTLLVLVRTVLVQCEYSTCTAYACIYKYRYSVLYGVLCPLLTLLVLVLVRTVLVQCEYLYAYIQVPVRVNTGTPYE